MIINDELEKALAVEDPNLRLVTILQYLFQELEQDPGFWELFYSLRAQPSVMSVLGDQFRQWAYQLCELLRQNLAEAGWEDPDLEARILFSQIEGTILQYLMDPTVFPLQKVVNRLTRQYAAPPRI